MEITKPIIFFDLETTGVEINTARIVQIACIKINADGTKEEKEAQTDGAETSGPQVPDVIASKMFEQSKMSTINTVYIGSLTMIGLYVLFRYMKY